MHDVIKSLLLHVRGQGQRNDMEVVNLYAATCLLREDGHFVPPSNITSVLAAMKHFIKLSVIQDASEQGKLSDEGIRDYGVYLDVQRSTPYGTVSRLQSLMSYGTYKEQRMPRWVWKHEGVLINGLLTVSAAALRDLAKGLMARSREALDAVLTEHCVRQDFVGREDHWGSTEKYYGFARPRNDLLKHLSTTFLDGDGRVNKDAVLVWEGKVAKFLGWIMATIHVTAGQPARIPELLTLLHANSSTSRALCMCMASRSWWSFGTIRRCRRRESWVR